MQHERGPRSSTIRRQLMLFQHQHHHQQQQQQQIHHQQLHNQQLHYFSPNNNNNITSTHHHHHHPMTHPKQHHGYQLLPSSHSQHLSMAPRMSAPTSALFVQANMEARSNHVLAHPVAAVSFIIIIIICRSIFPLFS